MAWKLTFLVVILFSLAGAGLFAQTPSPSPSPSPTPAPSPSPSPSPTPVPLPTPAPYTAEEFPGWLLSLRHAEIIFFGSLPFSFLLATEGVEVGRYFANGQDPTYRPFPFRSGAGVAYTWEEQMLILGSTCAISLVVAIIDFLITETSRRPVPISP